MGLISLFSSSARKRGAAKIIRVFLHHLKRSGVFDDDPEETANQVMDYAFLTVPGMTESRCEACVLAAGALTVMLIDSGEPREKKSFYALALGAVLQHALVVGQRVRFNRAEEATLEAASAVYTKFYEASPINLDLPAAPRAIENETGPVAPTGRTQREAVVMNAPSSRECIRREYAYLDNRHGKGGAWELMKQAVIQNNGKTYDYLSILVGNRTLEMWFDITESWAAWNDEPQLPDTSPFIQARPLQ